MTYGEVKRATLDLIFSDTIAGDPIAETYNNQADYEHAIPPLVNDCQIYIATTVKKIPAMVKLSDLEKDDSNAEFDIYTLPEDLYKMQNGGLIRPHRKSYDGRIADRVHRNYRLYGQNQLWLPKNEGEGLYLEYYRYPKRLGEFPEDDTPLDNTPDTQACIPYWVAANIVIYDDAFRYASFYNTFEDRLGRITEPVFIEDSNVVDVYGFSYFDGF